MQIRSSSTKHSFPSQSRSKGSNDFATLFETTHETGLSGTGRLLNLFTNIEDMTPAEYKNGGKDLSINYSLQKVLSEILSLHTKKAM